MCVAIAAKLAHPDRPVIAMAGDGAMQMNGLAELIAVTHSRYAELIGFKGIRLDSPDAVGPAWDEALSADRPVLLEAVTVPIVPPLPPHRTGRAGPTCVGSLGGARHSVATLPGGPAAGGRQRPHRQRQPRVARR